MEFLIGLIALVGGVIGVIFGWESETGLGALGWAVIWGFGGLVGGACVGAFVFHGAMKERDAQREQAVRQHIRDHVHVLASRKRQLVKVDPYGVRDERKWERERFHFISSVLHASGPVAHLVEQEIAAFEEARPPSLFHDDMSGLDYEHFCAGLLRDAGWDASVTQASSDQGVDIVARLDGATVVLQCKKYGSPVGNKAVQEITAGRTHYGAEAAAVVSNAGYTRSARDLAQSCGVLLLHHDDLPNLTAFLKDAPAPAA